MGYMLDVVLEGTLEGDGVDCEGEGDCEDERLLREALKELDLARARANHAEEEMWRCQEAASKLKGNVRRMAIVRSFSEPDKNSPLQVLGAHELRVNVDQHEVARASRRRMSTGCMPDSKPRRTPLPVMEFEHILGQEENRVFQMLKPDIDAALAGEVACAFVCGAASSDKSLLADHLAERVAAQLDAVLADVQVRTPKVSLQMFELHGDQHRDLLDDTRARRRSFSSSPARRPCEHKESVARDLAALVREGRARQQQRCLPLSHTVISFQVARPKSVGQLVIIDVDTSDRQWTSRSCHTNLWLLLGGIQDRCSTSMLLMLDPAPGAQADTLRTLQFCQRLQSSLFASRGGARHLESADDELLHSAVAEEIDDDLAEEVCRLQKQTSEVLREVGKLKIEVEKKDAEILELRRREPKARRLSPKAAHSPCAPRARGSGGASSMRAPSQEQSRILAVRHVQASSKAAARAPEKSSPKPAPPAREESLRNGSKKENQSLKSRSSGPKEATPAVSQQRAAMRSMIRPDKLRPVARAAAVASQLRGRRQPEPAVPCEVRSPSCSSLSTSSSGSCSIRCDRSHRPACHRPQDALPLKLDLTHVKQITGPLSEGFRTPQTPRGRPPIAWWHSEDVAPASARGHAPCVAPQDVSRARSLYIVELVTPRTAQAVSFLHQKEDNDAELSPMMMLRPASLAAVVPQTGRSAISVSSDEDDIRERLNKELCQCDKENCEVPQNAELAGNAAPEENSLAAAAKEIIGEPLNQVVA
ncbi:unnamed protein product [Effrenium voratum]|nr:unnamed protein product [Effrenium voratum]